MINQNWVFSSNCGLDFSTNPPTPFSGTQIPRAEGCASISDTNGNLLLYTNGLKVWDSNNNVKATGLQGDPSSTQSSIIVPAPDNNREYYILTTDGSSGRSPYNHFNGIRINVDSWNSTSLTNHMVTPSLALPNTKGFSPVEKLTAIQHENCKDFWVITLVQKSNNVGIRNAPGIFRIFLVDSNGVHHTNDISIDKKIDDLGYLKASQDGKKIALANGENSNVLVFSFDRSLGLVDISSGITIIVPSVPGGENKSPYGIEFSPNNNVLYFGNLGYSPRDGYVYQVDLLGSTTPKLIATISNGGGWYAIGALQLGIDGVIYIAKPGENSLGAITSPDTIVPAVAFGAVSPIVDVNYITSLPGNSGLGLPNLLPNACEEADCNCGCSGCNKGIEEQNEELIERAILKTNTEPSKDNDANCPTNPFPKESNCEARAISSDVAIAPCFYLHWGDGKSDQIEEHDTEVFYITVCNHFNDILFKGLKITQVTLNPPLLIQDAHIIPDRFIELDCLEPCSCQTREFAIITRNTKIAGDYTIDIEYCYDEMIVTSAKGQGTATFPINITED